MMFPSESRGYWSHGSRSRLNSLGHRNNNQRAITGVEIRNRNLLQVIRSMSILQIGQLRRGQRNSVTLGWGLLISSRRWGKGIPNQATHSV